MAFNDNSASNPPPTITRNTAAFQARLEKSGKYNTIATSLEHIQHILLILSGKGGVGKSAISSQLAWSLYYYGYNVGILDIDICGPSIARMMGVEAQQVHKSATGWSPVYRKETLSVMSVAFLLQHKNDAIIWRGPRKNGLIKQFLVEVEWNALDFLIIDCPPGTSDEHISIAQLLSEKRESVHAIMVTTPQEMSLLDVRKEVSFARKVNLNILGIIENMNGFICPCCNTKSQIFKASTGGAKMLAKQLNVNYLGSLPIDPLLLQCCESGKSFLKYSYASDATIGSRVALQNIIKQIVMRIDNRYLMEVEQKQNEFKVQMMQKINRNDIKLDTLKDVESDDDNDEKDDDESMKNEQVQDMNQNNNIAEEYNDLDKEEDAFVREMLD